MIIAIKEKDRVVVGYSNLDVWGNLSKEDYVDEENVAIKFTESGRLFACAKLDRISDMLLYNEELLAMEITPASIVRRVIPGIKELLKKNNKSIDKEGFWGNTLLICDNESIYDIDPQLGFSEVDDYVCHGARAKADTTRCVLDATVGMPAEERIMKAMEFIYEIFNEGMFPIVITDTKSKRFKYVYEGERKYEFIDSI